MSSLLADRRRLLPLLATALVIAIGAFLIVVLSGDGDSGGSASAATPSATSSGGATKIDIADFKFKPEDVTVKAGSNVTWTNEDSAPHTATASPGFDTGTLKKGQSKTITVKAGTYSYVCQFHPFMTAKLTVK